MSGTSKQVSRPSRPASVAPATLTTGGWVRAGVGLAGLWLLAVPWLGARDAAPAHLYRGDALVALGRHAAATSSYRRALEVEPSHTGAYLALAEALRAGGDAAAARRLLRHGVLAAERPEPLRQALAGWAPE